MNQPFENSPLLQARIAGLFWVICIAGGIYGYFPARGTHLGKDSILIAGAAYLVVTVLLYTLLRAVNQIVAMLAAAFGIIGIATSGEGSFYFGIQCILVGSLVMMSTFLPRVLGILMVLAGLGQALFVSTLLPAHIAVKLAPIGFISDGIGEIAFALWLLIVGVNVAQWHRARGTISTS